MPIWTSPLYAILDLPHAGGLEAVVVARAMLDGGVGVLQLRDKQGEARARRALVESLAPLCAEAGVPFVINDDLALAESLAGLEGLWGVHLGREDALAWGPREVLDRCREAGLGLGLSTHDAAQFEEATRLRPDYLALGPIFPTRSKANPDPVVGLEALGDICEGSEIPVVAIGGIDETRALECLAAGAHAVASISALVALAPKDITSRCRRWSARLGGND